MGEKDLVDRIVVETAKILSKEVKLDNERLLVLAAEIIANRTMAQISNKINRDIMEHEVRKQAVNIMAERIAKETEHS